MKRYAFTLLELVFVIIVIGILAVLAMPNFRGNPSG
jgi:prepilin-type N-terminal cleavage/methylation domain-containing protein